MSAVVGTLLVNLMAKTAQFSSGLRSARSEASSFAKEISGIVGLGFGIGGGLGALAPLITSFGRTLTSMLYSIGKESLRGLLADYFGGETLPGRIKKDAEEADKAVKLLNASLQPLANLAQTTGRELAEEGMSPLQKRLEAIRRAAGEALKGVGEYGRGRTVWVKREFEEWGWRGTRTVPVQEGAKTQAWYDAQVRGIRLQQQGAEADARAIEARRAADKQRLADLQEMLIGEREQFNLAKGLRDYLTGMESTPLKVFTQKLSEFREAFTRGMIEPSELARAEVALRERAVKGLAGAEPRFAPALAMGTQEALSAINQYKLGGEAENWAKQQVELTAAQLRLQGELVEAVRAQTDKFVDMGRLVIQSAGIPP